MSGFWSKFFRIENVANGFIGDSGKTNELSPIVRVKNVLHAGIFNIAQAPDDETWLITYVGTRDGYAPVAREAMEKDDLIWDRIPGGIEQQTWTITGHRNTFKIHKPGTNSYWVLPSSEFETQVTCKVLDSKSTDKTALWKLIDAKPQADYLFKGLKPGEYYIMNTKNGPIDARHEGDKIPVVASSEPTLWRITKAGPEMGAQKADLLYLITYIGSNSPLSGLPTIYDRGKLYLDKDSRNKGDIWLIHPLPPPNVFMISRDNHQSNLGPIHWSLEGEQVSVLHEHNTSKGSGNDNNDGANREGGDNHDGANREDGADREGGDNIDHSNHDPNDCFWEIIPAE